MEYAFKLRPLFKEEIVKLDSSLVPDHFVGDRRAMSNCIQQVAEILDTMGVASAKAQGLLKPITTADKLRNSDHTVYLMVDIDDSINGSVVGLLKVGRKRLYVFDGHGSCHETTPMCILDFYIHESRQRVGCGKKLFEHMLHEEQVAPVKLAIDRPSEKFLKFLRKHYGLERTVPQSNNFVVFDGFFPKTMKTSNDASPNHIRRYGLDLPTPNSNGSFGSASPGSPVTFNGRHSAHKPESTIGKCLRWCPLPTPVKPRA